MTMSLKAAQPAAPIAVVSQTLGTLEIDPGRAIRITEPLAGFPGCCSYALVPHATGPSVSESIQWFQALERPFHAFIVADPWSVFPDYAPELPDSDAQQLGLGSQEDAGLFVILTISGSPSGITANLRAPIVVNVAERVAKQVVLLGDGYHTRHPVRHG